MKRSHTVILLMLGTGLGGMAVFSDKKTTEQLRQDSYASKAECTKDWGSEQNCKKRDSGASGGAGGGAGGGSGKAGRYLGPRYYWDRSTDHPVMVTDSGTYQTMTSAHPDGDPFSHSIGSTRVGSVTRGGFGHFSSFGRGG